MSRSPAFERVLYVTAAAGDPMFIPGNCQAPTNSHDNADNGTTAQRQAACESLVSVDSNGDDLGIAVEPGTLTPR